MVDEYNTGNSVPSSAMPDVWDNNATIDGFVNSTGLTVITRTGIERDTMAGLQKKADDQREQMAVEGVAVVEETRQNLIPLSRQYMTLAAAQADIANIPAGSATYVRSVDDNYLADEYINNTGTLEATGRKMISAEYVDALRVLITEEVAKIMASGAAQTTDAYPDIAELILDSMGNSTYQRYADGTSRFPALMVGEFVEFVQIAGGLICQARGTNVEVFRIMSSGSFVYGDLISWVSDDESLSEYTEVHMDGQGRIYRRVLRDGTVEQVGEGGASGDEGSNYPMVASVNGNIISVQNDVITQVTNDSGVSNIAPVAYKNFLRYLSDGSGNYKNYRATYDGKFKAREGNKKLIHVLLTGQSLAAGGSTISQSPVTTVAEADYGVICFSTGPKVDFKYDTLNDALLESVIPCRENVGTRPGQESPSSGIAKAILDATGETVLISDACSSGTDIAGISLGTATFSGGTKMIQAAVAMADKLGMEYVPVLILIHGNQNASAGTSIASYRSAMENLRASYENIINTETNDSLSLSMFIGQLSNIVPYGGTAGVTKTNTMAIAQYQEARDNEFIHLASAQYARPYSDGEHLTSSGYRTEGEVIGRIVGGWINDSTKSSLVPVESGVVQSGNTITIPVRGCVGNLVIDAARVADPGNYGFIITGATIASVAVSGSGASAQIVITKTDTTAATRVSYAETGIAGQSPGAMTGSRGCIRDSQAGVSLSGLPLYNDLAVFAFQL
ncbi:Uncharacterised protein [Raoultella terrigena]|uniref:hypothetical protein n=1 Tax=Raoultella terrigena TaxID=577 RepID=UPI000DFA00A5|nr:hypothetical protein [Raoultella terrigena]SUQ58398.1 Uncharacterised protein [Raoultella terrigena]